MESAELSELNRLKMHHGEHIILRLTYLKYSTTIDFNPYLLSAEAAYNLMNELSDQHD